MISGTLVDVVIRGVLVGYMLCGMLDASVIFVGKNIGVPMSLGCTTMWGCP